MGSDLQRCVRLQPDQGGPCGGELTHAMSEESSVTVDSSTSVTCGGADTSVVQYIGWTDEKHNLYLHSLERSFVEQLNNSKRIQGAILREGLEGPFPSLQLDLENCTSSDEFKVLQDGCWQNIDFQSQRMGNSSTYNLTKRSRIQNFPLGNGYPLHSLAYLQEGTSGVHALENGAFSCGTASTSIQHHIHYLNPVGATAEGTDQNFPDEDGKHHSAYSPKAKRVRISAVDRQTNDQVVPSGEHHKEDGSVCQ
ncbi:hypothetical protein SAY86_021102 [Trapa natans]|uniref:Uncharacterized protein n=1 Tax=Trapa natans TaxID=22666 RepID=A0AAN7RFE5_TRANT|nr:hypothetical protein SAY86_021102 [Trapa natans]